MARPTFVQACATYVHRYTLDHVPAHVRKPYAHSELGVVYYAPQYASDWEWYERTRFPGEPGLHGNSRHCESGEGSWPLGKGFLVAPYVKGKPWPALAVKPPPPLAERVAALRLAGYYVNPDGPGRWQGSLLNGVTGRLQCIDYAGSEAAAVGACEVHQAAALVGGADE